MRRSGEPEFQEITIPSRDVQSLIWDGDDLVDWVAGGVRYSLHGKISPGYLTNGFLPDAAVTTPDNRYAVLYNRLGTKGVVMRGDERIREIERSDHCAEVYEYPVAIFYLHNGRAALVHCPGEYNRLEFEDLLTGELLTIKTERKPDDYFHSRLAVSPDGGYLLSAGWVWQPFDEIRVFHVDTALGDASHLDGGGLTGGDWGLESAATFLGNDRIAVALMSQDGRSQLRLHNLGGTAPSKNIETGAAPGTMMPAGEHHVLNLRGYPKLVDLQTGEVTQAWPHIASGLQSSPIIWGIDLVPPMALDGVKRRIAIAAPEKITVLQFTG
jgi:hypothetical protein